MKDLDKLNELPQHERIINPKNRRTKVSQNGIKKRKLQKMNEHTPSYMECAIATFLAVNGIEYVMEKTWPGLESVLFDELLPVDFWLPGYRACIEYDGSHHIKRMNGDKSYSLDRRKLNDDTRSLFCLQRGFKLLRISSKDAPIYKELIIKFLDLKA